MAGVRDHTELTVWQLSDELRRKILNAVDRTGFDRYPQLRQQLVSASISPCANIAEGFGRFYRRDFARFLRMAKGSLAEIVEHVAAAENLRLLSGAEAREMATLAKRANGAVTRLIVYLDGNRRQREP